MNQLTDFDLRLAHIGALLKEGFEFTEAGCDTTETCHKLQHPSTALRALVYSDGVAEIAWVPGIRATAVQWWHFAGKHSQARYRSAKHPDRVRSVVGYCTRQYYKSLGQACPPRVARDAPVVQTKHVRAFAFMMAAREQGIETTATIKGNYIQVLENGITELLVSKLQDSFLSSVCTQPMSVTVQSTKTKVWNVRRLWKFAD